jgi:glyoxylase-like metal-dependent hydrolase (beta-lactamase superfamily II)
LDIVYKKTEVFMKSGILGGFLFGAAAVSAFAADPQVFAYTVGSFEVSMLVENSGPGRPGILLGISPAQLEKYAPGGTFQSSTNTFLIRGGGRTVVVDTGFGTTIFESMKNLGVKPEDVDTVLITHMHGDHIGGLQKDGAALFPRAKVYVARQERDYWLGARNDPGARAALAPYTGRVEFFAPGNIEGSPPELLPGIRALAAFGHTPGHTLFLLESAGQKFLIWGDLMHAEKIQFPLPSISVTYDTDPVMAAASRLEVLQYAARNNIPIGGMHLVYPAVGTVRIEGEGFAFIPAK